MPKPYTPKAYGMGRAMCGNRVPAKITPSLYDSSPKLLPVLDFPHNLEEDFSPPYLDPEAQRAHVCVL